MQPVHLVGMVKNVWKKSRWSARFRYIWIEPSAPYLPYVSFTSWRPLLSKLNSWKNRGLHFDCHYKRFGKITKSYYWLVMYVRLSFRMEILGFHWTEYNELPYLRIFRKFVAKIRVSLKLDKNKVYFTWRPISIFIIPCSFLLRTRNVSEKSCGENQNIHCVQQIFPSKIVPFRERVENKGRAGQDTDDTMVHAHCMLDN